MLLLTIIDVLLCEDTKHVQGFLIIYINNDLTR